MKKKVIIQLEQGAISNCLRQASFFDRNYGGPIEGQPEPYIAKTEQRVQNEGRKKREDQTQLVKEERKTSTSTSITNSSREQKGTTKDQAQLIKERKPKEKRKGYLLHKKVLQSSRQTLA